MTQIDAARGVEALRRVLDGDGSVEDWETAKDALELLDRLAGPGIRDRLDNGRCPVCMRTDEPFNTRLAHELEAAKAQVLEVEREREELRIRLVNANRTIDRLNARIAKHPAA